MTRRFLHQAIFVVCLPLGSLLQAQTAPAKPEAPAPTPVPYASVSELNGLLAQLEQASKTTQDDLDRLRVEKWKWDAGSKRQTQADVYSIKRNLQTALPGIIAKLRNSPEDLTPTFELYRNIDALYDVLSSVTLSTEFFGSKDEFQGISNDLSSFSHIRRQLGERLEGLTASKETELASLRTQVKTLQAQVPPPTPKKIIVDDDETPKKPTAKKKAVPKPPAKPAATTPPASTTTTPPPSQ